jgi:cob(I)alamin adenosyltransferase
MGSRIYTKTGDAGTTALYGGARISKASLRVDAYGSMDEANTFVGAARALTDDPRLAAVLEHVMHKLFNCASLLAHPRGMTPRVSIAEKDVSRLEEGIDSFEAHTGPLAGFVLPTGTPLAAQLHMARTVCRRAERRIVALDAEEPVDPMVLRFVNRTSDVLFAAARYANHIGNHHDTPWDSNR